MKVEITKDASLAISPREVKSFACGDVVCDATIAKDKLERLIELGVAKEVKAKKVEVKEAEPERETKADNPVVEDKSAKKVTKKKKGK